MGSVPECATVCRSVPAARRELALDPTEGGSALERMAALVNLNFPIHTCPTNASNDRRSNLARLRGDVISKGW